MRTLFLFGLLLSFRLVSSQTLVEKSIVNPRIDFIEIDATNCFDILLETIAGEEMQIEAKIDGEYHKDVMLNVSEKGNTLQVGASFQPNFIHPNDKLSAHKVVSIALLIRLPKYKSVVLNGTSCNVFAKGDYRKLEVSLNDGQCTLEQISEQVEVRTQSGDILIKADTALIQAKSKYGKLDENTIPTGDNSYLVNSVTGNIRFIKTE